MRSRPLVRGGGSSDFASTLAHGTDATPATAATGLRRPPHKQKHRRSLWRLVAAVAAFCVPTTPAAPTQFLCPASLAGPAKQPPLPQRRSQQPRLLFPSGEVWGCRCRSWPLSVPARVARRHSTPGDAALGPWCPVPSSDCCPEDTAQAPQQQRRRATPATVAAHRRRAPAPASATAAATNQQWRRCSSPWSARPKTGIARTNGPRSLEHSGPPATAATRRPPALRPAAATEATGFRRVSWVFFPLGKVVEDRCLCCRGGPPTCVLETQGETALQ